ncbi:MAG: amidohydrolase family protein [Gemmatimonadales bacterium]
MRSTFRLLALAAVAAVPAAAQRPARFGPQVTQFIAVDAPVVAITNVRVVDGLGGPAREGQTVLVRDGKIASVGPAASASVPAGARTVDGTGKTLIPGMVGLHDHSYYTTSGRVVQSSYSAPLLYLASGVTTIRTTGANNPYAELNLKKTVDRGDFPGPRLFITGPYLTGGGLGLGSSMVNLGDEEEARRVVAYWAQEGVSWLKFYTGVSRAAMKAAIEEGHKHGLKFTGHLCSVPYREAVALGIDGLEHGLFANSDYDKSRKPDECSPNLFQSFVGLDMNSPDVQATFKELAARNVALTSTLVVYELFVPNRPPLDQRVLDAMSPDARSEYLTSRAKIAETPNAGIPLSVFKTGMAYERAFAKAGGILGSGVDPTGNGGALFGYGDQRNVELLVEAGFTPEEAIQVASSNGAKALGIFAETGSIVAGKNADLVLIAGNPVARIQDIRNVELVFRDGVGYDSAKMIAAVRGLVGVR